MLHADEALIQVYQPTSLLGTEMSADPLDIGEDIDATIVSRPILTKGVFPESYVYAISLPHRIAGASKKFPSESNLIVIVGGKISMDYNENSYGVIADFSKAKLPEDIGLTLVQIMKITSLCLQKTLGNQHETPLKVTWIAPEGISIVDAKLLTEIK